MPIINGQGRVAVRVTGSPSGGGSSSSYLLDTYGGAAAAYSLRKLSSTYSGSAIRVRRSSDNTEQNIGFDGSGNLDTTALTSFVGAGNGFVTTWYDQSGNGNDVTQSTAANQPTIVSSGIVVTTSGKPTIQFGKNDTQTPLKATISPWSSNNLTVTGVVNKLQNLTAPQYYTYSRWYSLSNGGADWNNNSSILGMINGYYTNPFFLSTYLNGTQAVMSVPNNTPMITWSQKVGGTLYTSKNNDSLISTSVTNSTLNITRLYIGGTTDGSFDSNLYGYQSETIFWLSDQSSNRSGINSNINTYYSIY